jgi:Fur family ferric uptake transcriptional regulator
VHFKCSQCGQTICINDVHVPAIALPGGYQVNEQNVLLQGTCPSCN